MHVECSRRLTALLYALHCDCAQNFILFFIQVYMVSGGYYDITGTGTTDTSETLEKDGGSAWQLVASLPSGRYAVRGVGLDGGRFMITGECRKI